MAEFGGYMYAGFAPIPTVYQKAAKEKQAALDDPNGRARPPAKAPPGLRRAHSASRAKKDSKKDGNPKSFKNRFRGHARTQSGSSASRSSHEDRGSLPSIRVSSSPIRTSKESSTCDPDLPQTQLPTAAVSTDERPPSGTSTSRGMPPARASATLDDVSHYPHFYYGQAYGLADHRSQQSQRRATEPSSSSSQSSSSQQPPSSLRVQVPGSSGSGSGGGSLDNSQEDRATDVRPDSASAGKQPQAQTQTQQQHQNLSFRGRATLDRFHVPRLPFSLTSSSSTSTTPTTSSTPTPTPGHHHTPTHPPHTPTPSTPTQAQAQVHQQGQGQAQFPHSQSSPLHMDSSFWALSRDHSKFPPDYQHQVPSSPDSSKEKSPLTSILASPNKINPSAISISQLTEHISVASVAAHAAMASPYASKNVSNPSIDASLSGTGRGSTSTSLSRLPSSNSRPFTLRAGRTYLADPSIPYPLPVDLSELHRQSLRTLLQIQVFGAPICSSVFASRPPVRVLEVGCGAGFWSMMCHRYFSSRGHSNISFVGMDVAPLAPTGSSNDAGGAAAGGGKPDRDMKWKFVQHDMRYTPWPFPDEEFDLIMAKEVFIGITGPMQQTVVDEYLRLLRPGGVLEIWESDHQVRMLRPHAPQTKKKMADPTGGRSARAKAAAKAADDEEDSSSDGSDDEDEDESSSSDDEASAASGVGAYVMTANTPLSAPLNSYLVEYNTWINRALLARDLSAVPCTILGPLLLQESDELTDVRSRRLAIPLAEVRWEREGVGGVVTKDGKSYIDSGRARREAAAAAAKGKAAGGTSSKRLTAGQAAVRRTAMLTVVQFIQSLEPLLRETSGKSQDEWDGWMGKMMNDLMRENGAGCGECLEVGAWWARKKGGR